LFVFAYKEIFKTTQKKEKKICVKLCCIEQREKQPKKVLKPKIPLKKIYKPKKKINKQKPKKILPPKKVISPIPLKKEEKNIKQEEIEQVEIEQEEIEDIKEDVEPIVTQTDLQESNTSKKIIQVQEIQENPHAKANRLAKEYTDKNILKIIQLLQDNLYYPKSARRRGIVGKVELKFEISTEGEVYNIEIVSSKSDILSRAATKTIQKLSGKFPKPTQKLNISVPIVYKLNPLISYEYFQRVQFLYLS